MPNYRTILRKSLWSKGSNLPQVFHLKELKLYFQFGLGQHDDNHIFEFVKSKLGFVDESNFEVKMYRCLPAFQAIDTRFYVKMLKNLLLPIYLAYVTSRLALSLTTIGRIWKSGIQSQNGVNKKNDDFVWLITKYFIKTSIKCIILLIPGSKTWFCGPKAIIDSK